MTAATAMPLQNKVEPISRSAYERRVNLSSTAYNISEYAFKTHVGDLANKQLSGGFNISESQPLANDVANDQLIDDEAAWDALYASSHDVLEDIFDEIMAESRAGNTVEIR